MASSVDLAGVGADGVAQKADGAAGRECGVVGPAVERGGLRCQRLARRDEQRPRRAGKDGHVFARCPADGAGQHGAFLRLAADGGDAQQFALRLGQQVSEADGIVDIAADVGVE